MNAHDSNDETVQLSESELETFAPRLRQAIGDRSLRSFARTAGVSETVLRKYIAGESEPTRPALIAMARAARVRLEWLAIGEGPMLAGEQRAVSAGPEPAPHKDFEPDPRAIEEREQRFLAAAVRIVDDRLHSFELRSYTKPEEFAELVRIVLADLKRGSAEDAAAAALDRVLNIARTPHQA